MKYVGPPDSLIKQISAYNEEKFEDEEDLRDQVQSLAKARYVDDQEDPTISQVLQKAQEYPEVLTRLYDILGAYKLLLERDIPLYVPLIFKSFRIIYFL